MTQPNYHLMKVKAKIHSKYYSVERRKTAGRKEKTKTKKTNKIKGSNKEEGKRGNQDGP